MPAWSNRPPENPKGPSLPIARCPTNGQWQGTITCHDLLGTNTHFYKGRTVPCQQPNCEPCCDGVPWRWHGYLTAINDKSGLHYLFEVPAAAAETIADFATQHGTLRGARFRATRLGAARNGRVIIEIKQGDPNSIPRIPVPDIVQLLTKLWDIPEPAAATTGTHSRGKRVLVNSKEVERLQTQLESARSNGRQSE